MKLAKDYLAEANEIVPRIASEEGVSRHAEGGSVFIDVRDSGAVAQSGTIAGALRIPRGMMEFVADPGTPFHNPALTHDARIVLICGAGGQAALAGKTLKEMGFTDVVNVGGVGDWKTAGGPMEE